MISSLDVVCTRYHAHARFILPCRPHSTNAETCSKGALLSIATHLGCTSSTLKVRVLVLNQLSSGMFHLRIPGKMWLPAGKEAEAIEEALGIPVIRHHDKKPAGGAEDIEKHFGYKANELTIYITMLPN